MTEIATKIILFYIFQFIVIVITFILLFLEIFLLFECRSTLDIEMTTLPVIEIHVISNSLDYGIVYI